MFSGIFICLLLYLVYFNVFKSADVINSPYNTRQDTFADRVVRGSIYSADREVLARTDVASDGSETRVYPYSNMFAHVVGYDTNGKTGVESIANFHLLTSNAFFGERVMKELKEQKNIGDNVITTLNYRLQKTAYEALGNYRGAVVVMEPETGKILAMVSKPDYDPNTVSANWNTLISSEKSELLNRATQGQYTPGSVFKIVTALEYIRENPDYESFSFDCQGSFTNEGYTISCYHGNQHGQEDFNTAFAKSCNSAFASIGLTLDRDKFRRTCSELLFNEELPVSIPYTKSTFSLAGDSEDSLAMMTAMGQGKTMVSPMHMALITSAIANGGVLMQPYLVDSVENYTGDSVKKYTPSAYGKLMTAEEAQILTDLMEGVVTEGTASRLSGQSYTAAGKTGTAEFSSDKSKSHAWFTGFSNVDSPDIVVTVIVEEAGSGSEYAVPIAKKIFDAYYN
ncbi:MAG: penicillin-binding transpeptidase domain-containing protein [Lachnospiraceae bacterium]|nr:penicillin-binding transpeptidase domain-containing protein [Lachnospiraceae bacterium]